MPNIPEIIDRCQETQNILWAAEAETPLEAALRYRALGYAAHPILAGTKNPGIEGWAHSIYSDHELNNFYATGKYGGVGLRPGVNGLVLVDADSPEMYALYCDQFPHHEDTYTEKTRRGFHVLLQVAQLPVSQTGKLKAGKIEVFYNTGQVVVSPSPHPDGGHYAPYKRLPVKRVPNIDDLIHWMLAQQKRNKPQPPQNKASNTTSTSDGDVWASIQRAAGIHGFKADGWSEYVPCPFQKHEHDDRRPLFSLHKDGYGHCLKCGVTGIKKELAAAYGIEWPFTSKARKPLAERLNPFGLPTYTATQTIDAEYATQALSVEELRKHPTLALKSGTGTAKTSLVGELVAQLPEGNTFLAINHSVLLTEGMAQTLKLIHYRDSALRNKKLWSSADQLACSINSLHYLAGRTFDRLFIDEAEQVFEYLNNPQTLPRGEASTAWDTLRDLIASAGQVIIADANLSDKTLTILESIRGHKPHAIENVHQRIRGDVVFLSDPYQAIHKAERFIADEQGPVLIPCATERTASEIHRYLSGLYGEDAGLKITRDTSETRKVKDFVRQINTELPRYRWLVYTSSMSSGVDIQTHVYAIVGMFPPQPLHPGNVTQMMGRGRHAQHRYLYITGGDGHYETNAQILFSRRQHNASATATRAHFADYGIPAWDKTTLALLRMEAEFSAQQNRERNQFTAATAERLRQDGFTIRTDETQNPALRPLFEALRITIEDERRELALTVDPVTHEQLDIYRQREMEITPAIRAGNLRWKIEDTVGQTITTVLYADFKSKTARLSLIRGADLLDVAEALFEADRAEAAERVPLHRRSYRSERTALFHAICERAGFKTLDQLTNYLFEAHSEDEIKSRFAFLQENQITADFRRLLGYQPERNATSITGLLRFFLRAYGLKLFSEKRMVEGTRGQWYFVAQDDYATWFERIQSRLAHQRATVQNLKLSLKNEVLDTQQHPSKQAIPPDWRAVTTPEEVYRLKSTLPERFEVGRGKSKYNPFSQSEAVA